MLIEKIASDEVLDTAYQWMCKQHNIGDRPQILRLWAVTIAVGTWQNHYGAIAVSPLLMQLTFL